MKELKLKTGHIGHLCRTAEKCFQRSCFTEAGNVGFFFLLFCCCYFLKRYKNGGRVTSEQEGKASTEPAYYGLVWLVCLCHMDTNTVSVHNQLESFSLKKKNKIKK